MSSRRCLQHIKSVTVRNVFFLHENDFLPNLYFKLVVGGEQIYCSEVAKHTINPIWLPIELNKQVVKEYQYRYLFQFQVYKEKNHTNNNNSRPNFTPKNKDEKRKKMTTKMIVSTGCEEDSRNEQGNIRGSIDGNSVLVMELLLDLSEFVPLGMNDFLQLHSLPHNLVLLELHDGIYIHQRDREHLVYSGIVRSMNPLPKSKGLDYDLTVGCDAAEKIVDLTARLSRAKADVADKKIGIAKYIHKLQEEPAKEHKRAHLIQNIENLKRKLAKTKKDYYREKTVVEEERKLLIVETTIKDCSKAVDLVSSYLNDEKADVIERRQEGASIAKQIKARRAVLLKQLTEIYPIIYIGAGEYKIRDIKISSRDLGRDEEQVSTALGYVSHLVFMLSKYLDVPLRFRIVHFSSRSSLKDDTIGNGAEYPLFRRGVDKLRFDYAVQCLKQNIDQLLFSRDIVINTSEPMLSRLKKLIDSETEIIQG